MWTDSNIAILCWGFFIQNFGWLSCSSSFVWALWSYVVAYRSLVREVLGSNPNVCLYLALLLYIDSYLQYFWIGNMDPTPSKYLTRSICQILYSLSTNIMKSNNLCFLRYRCIYNIYFIRSLWLCPLTSISVKRVKLFARAALSIKGLTWLLNYSILGLVIYRAVSYM